MKLAAACLALCAAVAAASPAAFPSGGLPPPFPPGAAPLVSSSGVGVSVAPGGTGCKCLNAAHGTGLGGIWALRATAPRNDDLSFSMVQFAGPAPAGDGCPLGGEPVAVTRVDAGPGDDTAEHFWWGQGSLCAASAAPLAAAHACFSYSCAGHSGCAFNYTLELHTPQVEHGVVQGASCPASSLEYSWSRVNAYSVRTASWASNHTLACSTDVHEGVFSPQPVVHGGFTCCPGALVCAAVQHDIHSPPPGQLSVGAVIGIAASLWGTVALSAALGVFLQPAFCPSWRQRAAAAAAAAGGLLPPAGGAAYKEVPDAGGL